MELLFLLAILVGGVFILSKVFGKKKPEKNPDKYMVVQERQTSVRNHIVKVPGKNKKR
jgi:hypothetical protein